MIDCQPERDVPLRERRRRGHCSWFRIPPRCASTSTFRKTMCRASGSAHRRQAGSGNAAENAA